MKHKTSILLAISVLLISCSHPSKVTVSPDPCLKTSGAIDMGSGSTKALVAIVNTCENKILREVYTEQVAIPFNDSLEKSLNQELDKEVIAIAEKEVRRIVRTLKDKGAQDVRAVATAAFRKAKNGESSAQKISKASGVEIHIVSQEEEAEIGIRAAVMKANLGSDSTPLGVWDIGGGSMQMTYGQKEKSQNFRGELASVSFKNKIIKDLLKKNLEETKSPNPLVQWKRKAVDMAATHALTHVSKEFRLNAHKVKWLGIGGVWWHSLRNQTEKVVGKPVEYISLSDLQKTLEIRAEMGDSELGGKFSDTDVSNIALVVGYMKTLKISRVQPVDASLLQGLLF